MGEEANDAMGRATSSSVRGQISERDVTSYLRRVCFATAVDFKYGRPACDENRRHMKKRGKMMTRGVDDDRMQENNRSSPPHTFLFL